MMNIRKLRKLTKDFGISIRKTELGKNLKGLYFDNVIMLDTGLDDVESYCILAEEIGHHLTADRNILDCNQIDNLLCEMKGRIWSYEFLMPISQLRALVCAGIKTVEEIADFFEVTKSFAKEALLYYFYSGQINEKAPCEAGTFDKGQ